VGRNAAESRGNVREFHRAWSVVTLTTVTAAILHRTPCFNRHLLLRTGRFCRSTVLLIQSHFNGPFCGKSKNVFHGLITMVRTLVAGLEHTYQSRGLGDMASTMMILEIMHTHYWEKEGSSRSDTSNQSLVVYSTSFTRAL